MLYLMTGLMGSGKTLNAIKYVNEDKAFQGRKIYYCRIQLTEIGKKRLGWTEVSDEEIMNWRDYPPGTVFVIDECDHIFPQRTKDKMPEYIRELKESRKRGIDFVFITQNAMQMDVFVRRNIGHYIHFERRFGADNTKRLQWSKYVNPEDKFEVHKAEKDKIKLDKKYFGWYESAEQHTHVKRLPYKLMAMVAYGSFAASE